MKRKARRKNKKRLYLRKLIFIIIGLLVLILLFGGGYLWLRRHEIAPSSVSAPTTKTGANNNAQSPEYWTSFTDLFSGTAWLDQSQTTLAHDTSGMVLTFAPDLEWQKLGNCQDPNIGAICQQIDEANRKNEAGPHCLTDGRCLSLQDGQIIYQKKVVPLPVTSDEQLVNVAITPLGERWIVVGVKVIAPEQYQPLAWWFDGSNFSVINLASKVSNYLGQLAIGGSPDNFLILYSAEDGLAWQVRGDEIRDISYYFGFRVNNHGFKPAILQVNLNDDILWFVFDRSASQARLLKFWQNGSPWIEAMTNLSSKLPVPSSAAIFTVNSLTPLTLRAKLVDMEGQSSVWLLTDKGFILPSPAGQVTSVNLTSYSVAKAKIVGAKVADMLGGWSQFNNQLFLSTDGQTWQPVNLGQRINFPSPVDSLWWRWQVSPTANKQRSPCLKTITINYYRVK